MKLTKKQKLYVYQRDGECCYFCGKRLKFKQVTMDHYLPKSSRGSDDIFNIVLSCRKCNREKNDRVPDDYPEKLVQLFKKGIRNEIILPGAINVKSSELVEMVKNVDRLEDISKYVVFQSSSHRFYVKENKVEKIVQLG